MGGGVGGQSLGQKEGTGLRQGKIVVKMAGGLFPGGRSRIHRVITFLGRGSFEVVRRIRMLKLWSVGR